MKPRPPPNNRQCLKLLLFYLLVKVSPLLRVKKPSNITKTSQKSYCILKIIYSWSNNYPIKMLKGIKWRNSYWCDAELFIVLTINCRFISDFLGSENLSVVSVWWQLKDVEYVEKHSEQAPQSAFYLATSQEELPDVWVLIWVTFDDKKIRRWQRIKQHSCLICNNYFIY